LTPWRGKPGRPRQKESEEVVLTWIKIGRPSLSRQNLARTFYGEAFTKADTAGKKKMIDRCQKAVERRVPPDEIRLLIKSKKISGNQLGILIGSDSGYKCISSHESTITTEHARNFAA